MKEKNKATGGAWKVTGNLRFPLDKTYHGCPVSYRQQKEYPIGSQSVIGSCVQYISVGAACCRDFRA